MNCAELEILICDYVDGTLAPAEKAVVESHLAACPACAELARDSAAAVSFIGHAADVEPPPELITRILFDAPWTRQKVVRRGGFGWLTKWFAPVLRPKFVMGAAMTILSLSMLTKYVAPMRQIKPSDLKPSSVWATIDDKAHLTWARTVKYYENLKVVYQIQTLLRDWQQQAEDPKASKSSEPKTDDRKLPVRAVDPAVNPGGAPASNPSGASH
jgi:hypothetical protein